MPIGTDDDTPDPLIGQDLAGRYRVEAKLGSGGMGAVYRGHHLALDRPVAIKVLHAGLTKDPIVAKRFDREALAASKLEHPNCVQMLDAGTTDNGMKFLVMQLLEGRELKPRGPMPPALVVEFTSQILRGLEHAHRRGLVHRDLKPENVIVVKDDEDREIVKLVDFGLVKLLSGESEDEKLTRVGHVFGTPRYMSPEQAAGGKIDERTDLYAVGVLMYEMLSGAPPFDGDEMGIVLRMHILSDPPPLPETVPAGLRAVVMRLLEKSSSDRYPSAKATRGALEAAADAMMQPAAMAAPPTIADVQLGARSTAGAASMSTSQVHHTVVATPPPTFVPPRRAPGRTIPVVLVILGVSIWIAWMVFSTRDCGASRSGGEVEVGTPAATRPKHDTIQRAVIKGDAPGESMDEQPEREAPKKREKNAREARKKLEKKAREAGKNRRKRERDD